MLIRIFALIEILAFLLYFLGTFLDQYKQQIYDFLPFSNSLPYPAFKFPFLSLIQFLITVYAFLRWYSEAYTIRPGAITHEWGVFFKKEKTVPLQKSMTITESAGPVGKIFRYGTIRIENPVARNTIVLPDIPRPPSLVKTIQSFINPQGENFQKPLDLNQILTEEENEQLEFKSSLRFDYKTGAVNRDLEKTTMKTIAAFLNSKGGHLVIGVNDAREPLGLEKDYETIQRPDTDGFENHFTQVFNSMIGPEFRHLVNVSFHNLGESEICVIQSTASPRPVYLKNDGNEHFYIRTGNTTTALKLSEIESYSRSRKLFLS